MGWWFSRSHQIFSVCYTIIYNIFIYFFEIILIVLKMLTENLLRISFSVICWCSLVSSPHFQEKFTCNRRVSYYFTGSQAAFLFVLSGSKLSLLVLWRKLPGGLSKFVSLFIGANYKFFYNFLKTMHQKIVKPIYHTLWFIQYNYSCNRRKMLDTLWSPR
jgi:hypothetical protein